MLKRFKIKKLFGFRDIDIVFEDTVKILIGENGLGKTTALNALYYVLTQKYHKLSKIDFEEILITLSSGKISDEMEFTFSKVELDGYIASTDRKSKNNRIKFILPHIDIDDINGFLDKKIKENSESHNIEEFLEEYIEKNQKLRTMNPRQLVVRDLFHLINDLESKKFNEFSEHLNNLNFKLLYFPTYRRVEEELKNIGKVRRRLVPSHAQQEIFIEEYQEEIDISEDTLIHFGMDDVKRRIADIEEQINMSTISGFSKVTGEMLSQLLRGFPEIKDKDIDNLNIETAKIVLDRVGNNLPSYDRRNILNLLDRKDQLKQKKELVYFLFKLIEIYNQHKHIDDSIKQFRDVCNRYLVDKKFVYDESSVKIRIYRNDSKNDIVELDTLSSGEKQIVSLFSKIYLDHYDNILVLFDEPELSLSIEWQKQLLPDIIDSERCGFLLAVTHSPFIFKNKLDEYAIGINVYIS